MNTFQVPLLSPQNWLFPGMRASISSLKEIPEKIMFKCSHRKVNSMNKCFLRENSDGYGEGKHLNLSWCYLCICTILKSDSFGSLSCGKLNILPLPTFCSNFPSQFPTNAWKYVRLCEEQWLWSVSQVSSRTAARHPKQGWVWSCWGWMSGGWVWLVVSLQVWDKHVGMSFKRWVWPSQLLPQDRHSSS